MSQSNDASSSSSAGNVNWTNQAASQSLGGDAHGCCGGTAIQAIGQSSRNWQGAEALAVTLQLGAKQPCRCDDGSSIGNRNEPTRILSPGNDGSVRQSNDASSDAVAANWNATNQEANQLSHGLCLCKRPAGGGIQAAGQESVSGQFAAALAATLQLDAANAWAPERKASPGAIGDLTQAGNDVAKDASGSRTTTDQSKKQLKR